MTYRYHILFFVLALALAVPVGLAFGFLLGPWGVMIGTLVGAAMGGGALVLGEEVSWRRRNE